MNFPKYRPSLLYRNSHFNTMISSKYRKVPQPNYKRKRYNTIDGDYLDIDILKGQSDKGLILFHGLEGSSDSIYIRSISSIFNKMGYWTFAVNFRGCSGEDNLKLQSYHSGKTDDISFLINSVIVDYNLSSLNAIGYSLGANALLKYLGDDLCKKPKKLGKCIGVSPPLDLRKSSLEIRRWFNYFYQKMFLTTLKEKAEKKYEKYKNCFDINEVLASKDFFEFDHRFTAPCHGFLSGLDYYKKSSALFYLKGVKHKTLIISAKDDSFLADTCYPEFDVHQNDNITTHYPKHGGHVGFGGDENLEKGYLEEVIMHFLK